MRTLWIVAVLLLGVEGDLLQFETLIMKIAGRSGIWNYSSYGCYCGAGDQGWPQDASDRCCFEHKCCYANVTGCDPKTDVYTYRQEDGDIVCGGEDLCGTQICECDKAAAICFRDSMDTYDHKYRQFSPENCQGGPQPC